MLPDQPARACGVDFGTSNSTVGWWRPGHPTLLPLEADKATLPSVVFFNADEDSVSFGRAGLEEYLDGYEGRLMRSLKSLLGGNLLDGRTEVRGRSVAFRDLLRFFIAELKRRAESTAGRVFDQAVFGRPVYFVDDNPEADRLAESTLADVAREVGFKDVSFQFEPIAAAYHYEQSLSREELVLIADIGGGTSDFSLIRLSPQRRGADDRRADLLANGGVHIGGTDFDRQFSLAAAMPLLGLGSALKGGREMPSSYYFNLATWHTINQLYARQTRADLHRLYADSLEREKLDRLLRLIDERAGHWLALQVEAGKIALSDAPSAALELDRIEAGFSHEVSRDEFEDATAPLAERVAATVAQVAREAGVATGQIDTLFITGGASGVPHLRARIAALCPDARLVEGDLFGSIGAGLAVDAARRYG